MPFDEEDLGPHDRCAHEISALEGKLSRAKEAASLILKALEQNEWQDADRGDEMCQNCLVFKGDIHEEGCWRDELLALARATAEVD